MGFPCKKRKAPQSNAGPMLGAGSLSPVWRLLWSVRGNGDARRVVRRVRIRAREGGRASRGEATSRNRRGCDYSYDCGLAPANCTHVACDRGSGSSARAQRRGCGVDLETGRNCVFEDHTRSAYSPEIVLDLPGEGDVRANGWITVVRGARDLDVGRYVRSTGIDGGSRTGGVIG